MIIYTDGACLVHGTKCGGAAVVNGDDEYTFHECNTTSQRMELAAVALAISSLPSGTKATLRSDSQYVVRGYNEKWKLKSNLDLWDMLRLAMTRHKVTLEWIPRRSCKGACRADNLAGYAAQMCSFPHVLEVLENRT